MKKLFTKRFACTMAVLFSLTLCSTAFANQTVQLDPEPCAAVMSYTESLSSIMNGILDDIKDAESDIALISKVVVHDRELANHWELSPAWQAEIKATKDSLGDNIVSLRRIIVHNQCGNHIVDVNKLASRSIKFDPGKPGDDNRAAAMVNVRKLCKKLSEQCITIHNSVYSSNFGEVRFLDEAGQIDLYVQWLRFKKQLDVLKPVIDTDNTKVSAGAINLEGITHYDIPGRNHWALARNYKAVMSDISKRIDSSYRPLHAKGIKPNRSDQLNALHKLCKKIEWDLGKPDADDAFDAVKKTMKLIDQGLRDFDTFNAGFKANVKDSDRIIAAAEQKFDDGDGDTTNPGDQNTINNDQQQDSNTIDFFNVTSGAAESSESSVVASQQTDMAAPASSYTVKDGDTLGDIALQLRNQFLAAGWKEEDIPGLWGGNGLVEVIANSNNMSDINQTIHADTELTIPAVPKPAADGNGTAAFQAWAQNAGAVSPGVTEVGNSNPSGSQASAMTSERIHGEVGSFMTEYFPGINDPKTMVQHLRAKPRGDKTGPDTNFKLLIWDSVVLEIIQTSCMVPWRYHGFN